MPNDPVEDIAQPVPEPNSSRLAQTRLPPANPVFESAMGVVSFVVLVLAVSALLVLFVLACFDCFGPVNNESLDLDSLKPPKTELYWPWDAFVWLVSDGAILNGLLILLGAILAVGIRVISENTRSRWLAFTVIGLCLCGTLLAVLLMWQLSGEPDFGKLRSPANLTDYAFSVRLNGVLIAYAGWFLIFLARQVGVSAAMDWLKGTWNKWMGGR